ncbi:Apq12p [Saccharomyces cerevisiae AWRI796]|nr:Apq12p [Saccharomyces cerevisiae AWRI796]
MDATQPQYELSVVTQCLKSAIDVIQWLIPTITKFSQSHPLVFQLLFIFFTFLCLLQVVDELNYSGQKIPVFDVGSNMYRYLYAWFAAVFDCGPVEFLQFRHVK